MIQVSLEGYDVVLHAEAWNLVAGTYTVQPGDTTGAFQLAYAWGMTADALEPLPPPGSVIQVPAWMLGLTKQLLATLVP